MIARPRLSLVLTLLTLTACETKLPVVDESDESDESDDAGETGEPAEPAELAWVYQASECGHAYGVVAHEADAIVAGSIAGQPWIARFDEHGELVWEHVVDRDGVYFAIDHGPDPSTVVTAGKHTLDGVDHGLIETFTVAGSDGESLVDVGGPESAVHGVATIATGFAVTGVTGNFDMLVGVVDPELGELTTWAGPSGVGITPSVGFGVRAIESGGIAICGRRSAGEGGTSWTARYDDDGQQLWTASGPGQSVGAYLDCWALAVDVNEDVFVADYGYAGARLARYAGVDGALRWEASEPSVGTQAIDVGPDGTVYVGGWSADPSADPFRSHESGQRSGWLAAFDPDGALKWRVPTAMPLSIAAVRVHDDGAITAVGDLDPDSACSTAWIARFEP